MIEELALWVPKFEGDYNCVCCFAHIINLIAKSLLRQFDVQKGKELQLEVDDDVQELLKLVEGLEEEEAEAAKEKVQEEVNLKELDDDEVWVDEVALLDVDEQKEFEAEVRPLKMVLVTVCPTV